MIAGADTSWIASGWPRTGRRHRLRPLPAPRAPFGLWARFWSDRQAVRLKMILLGVCLLAAALLEGPR